jgi:hypothetical protein
MFLGQFGKPTLISRVQPACQVNSKKRLVRKPNKETLGEGTVNNKRSTTNGQQQMVNNKW